MTDPADSSAPPVERVADGPPAPEPAGPVADAPRGTSWDLVQRLKGEGVTRELMLARLKESGLDDEGAKVLVNSVDGAMPSELPSAQLTGGTDLLSPSVFTLSDIGLTGPPTVVGLYWMGFGAAILLALGLGWGLTEAGFAELPESVGEYAVRLGGLAASTCLVWGAYRYAQGVTIRRKP